MIEGICEGWSGFLLATYPRNSSRIWKASCVRAGEGYEEKERKQMRSVVQVES